MTPASLASRFDLEKALDDDQRAQLDAGNAALSQIRKMTITNWLAAGAAWLTLQRQAMYLSNSNQPAGRRYAEVYGLMEQPWKHLADADRMTRMSAIWLFENQAMVLPWYESLATRDRDRWLHPATIRRHFERERGLVPITGQPQGVEARPTALQHANGQLADLRAELDSIQAENRRLKRSHDNLSEGRDWSWQDTPEDIAAAMLRLYPDKAKRLFSAGMNLAKANEPMRRNRRQTEPPGERD